MLIKRTGPDGTERTRDLNITAEEYADWEANKAPSKEIFTNLSEEDIIFKKYILDVLPVSSKKSKISLINFKILISKSYKVFPYLQPESTGNGYCNTSKNGLNRQCIQPE